MRKHAWTEYFGEPVLRIDDTLPDCEWILWRIRVRGGYLQLQQVDRAGDNGVAKLPNTTANLERLKRLAEQIKDAVVDFHAEGSST